MLGHIDSLGKEAHRIGDNAIEELAEATHKFANAFSRFMPTTEIAKYIPQIKVTILEERFYASGAWLIKALFWEKDAVMHLDHDHGKWEPSGDFISIPIIVLNQPSRQAVGIWTLDDYYNLGRVGSHFETRMAYSKSTYRSDQRIDSPQDLPLDQFNRYLSNIFPKGFDSIQPRI